MQERWHGLKWCALALPVALLAERWQPKPGGIGAASATGLESAQTLADTVILDTIGEAARELQPKPSTP